MEQQLDEEVPMQKRWMRTGMKKKVEMKRVEVPKLAPIADASIKTENSGFAATPAIDGLMASVWA